MMVYKASEEKTKLDLGGGGDMPSRMTSDDQAKMAANHLVYGQLSNSAVLPVAPSLLSETPTTTAGLVESGVTLDLMGRGGRMTSVRRTFCLFTLFDLFLMFILWVIYTQLMGYTGYTAFEKQVTDYSFKTSLFDTVMLALFRFVLLLLSYGLFRLRHWTVVAITTGLSSAFLIIKIFLFDFGKTNSGGNPLSYCLIIVSFVLAWVETWFLDFKVLPQEKKMEDRLKSAHRRGYGSTSRSIDGRYGRYSRLPDDMQSVYTEDNQFYSPLGSPEGSDAEDELDRGRGGLMSSKESEYVRLGEHSFDILWTYLNSPEEDWKMEMGENPVDGAVHSKKIKGVGKVFRTKCTVDMKAEELYQDITGHPELMPSWNPTMKFVQTLQQLNDRMDINYSVSAEAAGGVISSRDFVNVRCMGQRQDYFLGAAMAVIYPDKPPQKQYVRGVNGAGGMTFRPDPSDPENKCQFAWFMNTDIKGWFPQKLIDANMAQVGIDFLGFLRAHIADLKAREISTVPSTSDLPRPS